MSHTHTVFTKSNNGNSTSDNHITIFSGLRGLGLSISLHYSLNRSRMSSAAIASVPITGFWSWAGEHPWMLFFLTGSAIEGLVAIMRRQGRKPQPRSEQRTRIGVFPLYYEFPAKATGPKGADVDDAKGYE